MPSALQDIKGIIAYVRKKSFQNAEKLYGELMERIESLLRFPERGGIVKEITEEQLREIRLYHFRIIYRCTTDKVQVITVCHSSQLLSNNPHLEDLM